MALKLLENLRRSGSALFLDRDIQYTKGEFGQVLYDQVVKSLEHDIHQFVSTEDDPLIVAIRPALLETHREVKALEMKRAKAQKVLDEQAAAQQEAEKSTDNNNNNKPRATSFWGASSDRWTTAKYKTQVGLCEEKIRELKHAFGHKVFDKLVVLEQTQEDWQPSDPLVQTAWQMCRENVERLEKLKTTGTISLVSNSNGQLEDQVASTLASLSTPLGQESAAQKSPSAAMKNTKGRHHGLENQVAAALASLEAEHMLHDEAHSNDEAAIVLLEPTTEKQQSTESSPDESCISGNGNVTKEQAANAEMTSAQPVESVDEEPREEKKRTAAEKETTDDNHNEEYPAELDRCSQTSKEAPSEIAQKTHTDSPVENDNAVKPLGVEEGKEDFEHMKTANDAELMGTDESGKIAIDGQSLSESKDEKSPLDVSNASDAEESEVQHEEEKLCPTAEVSKDSESTVEEEGTAQHSAEHMKPVNVEGTDESEGVKTALMVGHVSIGSDKQEEVEEISKNAGEPLPVAAESENHEVSESVEEEEIDVEYVEEVEEEVEEEEYAESLEKSVTSAHSKKSVDDESDNESGSFRNSDSEDSSEDNAVDLDDGDDSSFSLTIHGEMDPSSIGSVDPLRLVERAAAAPSVKQLREEESVSDEVVDEEDVLFGQDENEVSNEDEQQFSTVIEEVEEVEVTVGSDSEVQEEEEPEITADGEEVSDGGEPSVSVGVVEDDDRGSINDGDGPSVGSGPHMDNGVEEKAQLKDVADEHDVSQCVESRSSRNIE
eukprot:scaffold5684_cov169-Amphora_coffeaeformis.AAC.4